jgi:hypothetical protein
MSEQAKRECVCMGAGPEFSQLLRKIGPGEAASGHFRNSRIEFLKGIRSMIDRQIENLSKTTDRGTKVSVE